VKADQVQARTRHQRGRTLLELAFSWLAAQPVVACVIAGATKPEQREANVKAA
jgi:aryl-alcohol dehydrogenase-like predicted oxidoreductase